MGTPQGKKKRQKNLLMNPTENWEGPELKFSLAGPDENLIRCNHLDQGKVRSLGGVVLGGVEGAKKRGTNKGLARITKSKNGLYFNVRQGKELQMEPGGKKRPCPIEGGGGGGGDGTRNSASLRRGTKKG